MSRGRGGPGPPPPASAPSRSAGRVAPPGSVPVGVRPAPKPSELRRRRRSGAAAAAPAAEQRGQPAAAGLRRPVLPGPGGRSPRRVVDHQRGVEQFQRLFEVHRRHPPRLIRQISARSIGGDLAGLFPQPPRRYWPNPIARRCAAKTVQKGVGGRVIALPRRTHDGGNRRTQHEHRQVRVTGRPRAGSTPHPPGLQHVSTWSGVNEAITASSTTPAA